VQDVLGGDGFAADAAFGKGHVLGNGGIRWWHTISMSRCSSMVLTVNGRVGLVELGSTLAKPQALMMSGAWPPPAPSV
jgi:hypothetical protein